MIMIAESDGLRPLGGGIMDFKEMSDKLKDVFKLEGSPVTITYSDEPDKDGDNRKGFVCVALQRAKRGAIINLSANNITCPGGIHWLGFMDYRPGEVIFLTYGEKFFKDEAVAEEWFDAVPAPPLGRAKFVVLRPLELVKSKVDMVAFVTNSHQAHRIQTVLAYSEGSLCTRSFFSSTCQATIGIPIVTGIPSIVLPDTASRKFAKFTEDDLIVSLPYRYFLMLLENIDSSSGGTAIVPDEMYKHLLALFRKPKRVH